MSAVLSEQERQAWAEIERHWAAEAAAAERFPRRRLERDLADLPAPVVAGSWIAVLLVLFGAPGPGLVLLAVVVLGAQLSRPDPSRAAGAGAARDDDDEEPTADEHGASRLR